MTAALEERARIRKTCLDLASVEASARSGHAKKGHVDDAVIARCSPMRTVTSREHWDRAAAERQCRWRRGARVHRGAAHPPP